jgi:hypothetical protein
MACAKRFTLHSTAAIIPTMLAIMPLIVSQLGQPG